jgi:hypothetical protein
MSQADTNPFKYSDTNKRYYTYDYYLKNTYGEKCAKIPLEGGFTCPNIDGTKGSGGCIYCLGGSLAATCNPLLPLKEQYLSGIEKLTSKWKVKKFIPYLQSFSNTYTSPEILEKMLTEISSFEGACAIAVATRADCLDGKIAEVLNKISQIIPVTVELGLQTSSDETSKIINRCHTYKEFEDGFHFLRVNAPNVKIGIHIINGLPGENEEDMQKTATCVAELHPDFLKIHLLHVLAGTPLEKMYLSGEYVPMERDDYIQTVCRQLEILPPDIVIERLTGDGTEDSLIAPLWSKKKVTVINDIDKLLYKLDAWQGKYASES